MSNNTENKPLAVSYSRYSSTNQRTERIEAQEYDIKNYAEKNNIKIVKYFRDEAVSGTSVKGRNHFEDMINYCLEHEEIKFVLCHKLDRFARDLEDYWHFRNTLVNNSKTICYVIDNVTTDSPACLIQEAIIGANAQGYSANLKSEVMKGLKTNARNCQHTGGHPCLGFEVNPVTKLLEVNEDEKEIIERIFELYGKKGYSYTEIINDLNSKGYKTKLGGEFKQSSLYEILTNPKYNGVYVYNRRSAAKSKKRNNHKMKPENEIISIPNGCPKIIDDELWEAVQKRMKSNKNRLHKYSSKEVYLLKGKIFCECGELMYGNRRHSGRFKNLYVTYACKGRQKKSGCTINEINKIYIENFVIRQIKSFIFCKSNMNNLIKALNKYSENQNINYDSQKRSYQKKISNYNYKINNIIKAVESGINQPAFNDRVAEYTEKINYYKKMIEDIDNISVPVFSESDILLAKKKFIDKVLSNDSTARDLIDSYVDKVIVGENDIEVILNIDTKVSDCYR